MATDFNPDKERHADHKFYVRSATRRKYDKLTVDGRDLPFNNNGQMLIKDEGLARNIQTEYPDDLAVTRLRSDEAGHSYFFGSMPEMPWKKAKRLREQSEKITTVGNDDGTSDGCNISDVSDHQEPNRL